MGYEYVEEMHLLKCTKPKEQAKEGNLCRFMGVRYKYSCLCCLNGKQCPCITYTYKYT